MRKLCARAPGSSNTYSASKARRNAGGDASPFNMVMRNRILLNNTVNAKRVA